LALLCAAAAKATPNIRLRRRTFVCVAEHSFASPNILLRCGILKISQLFDLSDLFELFDHSIMLSRVNTLTTLTTQLRQLARRLALRFRFATAMPQLMQCKWVQSHHWRSFDGLAAVMGLPLEAFRHQSLGMTEEEVAAATATAATADDATATAAEVAVAEAYLRSSFTVLDRVASAQFYRVTALGAYLVSLTPSSDEVQSVVVEKAVEFIAAARVPGVTTEAAVLALGKEIFDAVTATATATATA